jgi:hypothetical protein
VDVNRTALAQAKYKAEKLELRNLTCIEADIFKMDLSSLRPDLVVALHSCGALADAILQKCENVQLLMLTCCFGKIPKFNYHVERTLLTTGTTMLSEEQLFSAADDFKDLGRSERVRRCVNIDRISRHLPPGPPAVLLDLPRELSVQNHMVCRLLPETYRVIVRKFVHSC